MTEPSTTVAAADGSHTPKQLCSRRHGPFRPAISFRVLGPIEISNGQPSVNGVRRRRLLAALLANRRTVVPFETLIEAVWSHDPPADPMSALHNHAHRLRRLIPAGLLRFRPPGLVLEVDEAAVDAGRFQQALNQARLISATDPAAALALLDRGLALWRGSAYAEFADEPIFVLESRRLEEQRLIAMEERYASLLALGRPEEALTGLNGLAGNHPLRERPRMLLMTAFDRLGRSADALASYSDYRTLLSRELGLEPSPALQHEQQLLLQRQTTGRVARSSAIARRDGVDHDTATTTLIGRALEITTVTELVMEHAVVTVTGSPGIGKSALVNAVADIVAPAFADAALRLDAAEASPEQALAALAAHPSAGRQARRLLVVDNADLVLDILATIAGSLRGTSATLLVASRSSIGLTFEQVFRLTGLAQTATTPDAPAPAHALFRLRSQQAGVKLDHGQTTNDTIAALCAVLDGIPLAIELAALRCRSMTPQEIIRRLEGSVQVLQGSSRRGRHRSFADAVDWTYGDLPNGARSVFELLARTHDRPATLAAVEQACEQRLPAEVDVLSALDSLVDASLLTATHHAHGMEYTIPLPLRTYGRGIVNRLRQPGPETSTEAA